MSFTYETITDLHTQLLKALAYLKDKYHIDETRTQSLAKDLSEVLFNQREAYLSFEKRLCEVKDTLEELIEKAKSGEGSLSESVLQLKSQVKTLSANTTGQPKYRRQLIALLAATLRRITPQSLNSEQLIALKQITEQILTLKEPSFEDVVEAQCKLDDVQIDVHIRLGKRADEFIRLMKEERYAE
jgi:hypothetical protein